MPNSKKKLKRHYNQSIATSYGFFQVYFNEKNEIIALNFPQGAKKSSSSNMYSKLEKDLKTYLSGREIKWKYPLSFEQGTTFQRNVWQAIARIPYGHTRTYGWVAEQIGSPKAMRAVGSACAKNPIPIIIPCHRVVASSGKLGGFSSGLTWKKRLLALEKPHSQ